ncbi:hypothetical protein C9E81_20755 [Paracoccus alkanivorans]|uniref:Uncharacterized protein n=1 Tax=Paracoccus alkanivorans TaxID=2116655 RepID=A0A3M0M218_9RHOB|nr:hypothetical protein C9E81_20755 [Paracoccus alkanivorans]
MELQLEELGTSATEDALAAEQASHKARSLCAASHAAIRVQAVPRSPGPRERTVVEAPKPAVAVARTSREDGRRCHRDAGSDPAAMEGDPDRAREVHIPGLRKDQPATSPLPCDPARMGRAQPDRARQWPRSGRPLDQWRDSLRSAFPVIGRHPSYNRSTTSDDNPDISVQITLFCFPHRLHRRDKVCVNQMAGCEMLRAVSGQLWHKFPTVELRDRAARYETATCRKVQGIWRIPWYKNALAVIAQGWIDRRHG